MRLQRAFFLLAIVSIVAACSESGASPLAELSPRRERVEVQAADADEFEEGSDGQGLEEGDVVRTDETGRTEIVYSDGSLTRLDVETTFEIERLVAAERERQTATRLASGNTWHRVKELSETDSFTVSTASATAAVRGTAFVVQCDEDGTCTFIVVEGEIELTLPDGTTIILGPGDMVTVSPDGEAGDVTTLSPDQLAEIPWIAENLALDEEAGLLDDTDATGTAGGTGDGEPTAADLDRSRLAGRYDVVLTATSVTGFRDLAEGEERERAYAVEVDCDEGACELLLERETAEGTRRTPLTYDDGVYRTEDDGFATQDCLMSDQSVDVGDGVETSVTVELEVTGASVGDGAWQADQIAGTVTETAERVGDNACLTGDATYDLEGRRAG